MALWTSDGLPRLPAGWLTLALTGPLLAWAGPPPAPTAPTAPTADASGPRLRCDLERADVQLRLETGPVSDPYTVPAHEVGESFRFKAVMVGTAQRIDYIKLYTYVYTPRQFVLMQQATYPAPTWPVTVDVPLTGVQRLYSHRTGGELRYACHLLTPAPAPTLQESR